MSVIIRLQGLSWSASALDIRNFFKGLSIPPGGVRIIGGENGDAFIAFSTDEDARQAMMLTNKPLNDIPVQLFLSSKTEMQNTISQAKDKSTSVSVPDATSVNSGATLISQQIPSVQEISRAFPAVGQIIGSLGIQPPQTVQVNQNESRIQSSLPHGTLQQPTGVLDFINNQQQNVNSNVGKQFEHDLPGEYSVGGLQGINKQLEIKPNTIGQYGLMGKIDSQFHATEVGKVQHPGNKIVTSVHNAFSNPRSQDNFHGEVYFPHKVDTQAPGSQTQSLERNFQQKNLNQNIPNINQNVNSTGHGKSFHGDQINPGKQLGHGKQLNMEHFENLQHFSNFPQSGRQDGPYVVPSNANFHSSNIPVDPYFRTGNKPNDPYNPPSNILLKNQPSLSSESRFTHGIVDKQSNMESSIRQNVSVPGYQNSIKLPTTSSSFDQSFPKSGMPDAQGMPQRSRQSRFAPVDILQNRPSESVIQAKDQNTGSNLTGSNLSCKSVKEDNFDQNMALPASKNTGSLILSNKQDEFGRNVPYVGRDSAYRETSRTTRDENCEDKNLRDRSDLRLRDSIRTSSRERDRSRDRSSRRDSPRDRHWSDRDRSRKERDDERRPRRDRDRDYDRKTRDRENERYERSRDRDDKRSPSINSLKKTRKRSLSPNDKSNNEKEKKLQTEKPEEVKKEHDKGAAMPKEEKSAIPSSNDKSLSKDTEMKNSNGKQALFPVVPVSKAGKGLLGEAPSALTGFGKRNMVQRGGPLLDTPMGNLAMDTRRDEIKPNSVFRDDKIPHSAMDISTRDRPFDDEHDYRDPFYRRDDDFNRDRHAEQGRHPRFFDRNLHGMHIQPDQEEPFEQRGREYPFDDRRPPDVYGPNRGQENRFFDNEVNRPPFHHENQGFRGRPSLLGDGGLQHDLRERRRPESNIRDFQRPEKKMPSLLNDFQDRRRPDVPRNERGLQQLSGPDNFYRNEPPFRDSRESLMMEDLNRNHREENYPDFYESGDLSDEHFNLELAGSRNIRLPFRGRGFRGRGMDNMRGGFNGPQRRHEFQGDRGKGYFEQERRSRFSNMDEQPFNSERRDLGRSDGYNNRSSERYQDRKNVADRSGEQVRVDINIGSQENEVERDHPTSVAGRSNESDGNRNRGVKRSLNEESSSHELKRNNEKQNDKESKPSEKKVYSLTETEAAKGNALCSVVLENIPVETTYKDIRKLFAGFELSKDGIKIINDNEGKRVGKAYVRFGSQESFKKGLQKDRTRMGNKPIVIKPVPRKEFDNAIDSYLPPDDDEDGTPDIDMCNSLSATLRALKGEPELKLQKKSSSSQNDFVVKITFLPEYAKIQNIKTYFQNDFKIANNGEAIVIESSRFKACTGLCYVEFADENSFKKALNLNRMFERKTIKIVKGSKKEMDELRDKMKNEASIGKIVSSFAKKDTVNKGQDNEKKSDGDSKSASSTEQSNSSSPSKLSPACICVRVKNIPKTLKVFELRNFFEGVGVNLKIVQICHDAVGKAIGEGYLEFTTHLDVQKCLVKDGAYINKNKIRVLPVTKPEMIENMRLLRQSLQPETPTSQAVFFYVKAENLPKNVSTGEIMNFFSGYNPAPESIRLNIGDQKDQPNCSTALIGFRSREQAETAIEATNGNILRNQTIKLTKVVI